MYPREEFLSIKKRLKRAWSPFFGRFGSLNPIQLAVIPHVLRGENVIIASPTASGKTEAVFAPLVERIHESGAERGLTILYISPTRALVNNIYTRLNGILKQCGLLAAVKTGDRPEFSIKEPEHVLFTTPESLDSLLCRQPNIWNGLKAIILDEIHLIDAGYRGDQLRILLERIRFEHMRLPLQYAALSATLYEPEETALRYFQPVTSIRIGEPRALSLTLFSDLKKMIEFIKQEKMHKVLIFANSRRDVERLGAELKAFWPKDRIVIHHGSLSRQLRNSAEKALQEWRWGICIATMTLEIGIDIGDFEAVACYRPPHTPSSFQQRVGRGCRQREVMQALGYCETEEEKACFQLYAHMARQGEFEPIDYTPDTSVAVQQIFSYLFCHTRGEEKARLESLLSLLIDPYQIETIIDHLIDLGYINQKRDRLYATEKLMDLGEKGIIHSNIPILREYRVIDRNSGRQIGEVGLQAVPGAIFVLGGRVWETLSIKGFNLYARTIAQKPEFKHFRKKSPAGAFSRFLPDSLKDQ
jgi:ATP-dependent Lhr-like helicase